MKTLQQHQLLLLPQQHPLPVVLVLVLGLMGAVPLAVISDPVGATNSVTH